MGAKGPFRPLVVTSLVEPEDYASQKGKPEALAHCSGHVFDIDYSALPPAELECLRFVLSDLGWEGYLGFVEDGMDSLHIGCSPGLARVLHHSVRGSGGQGGGRYSGRRGRRSRRWVAAGVRKRRTCVPRNPLT